MEWLRNKGNQKVQDAAPARNSKPQPPPSDPFAIADDTEAIHMHSLHLHPHAPSTTSPPSQVGSAAAASTASDRVRRTESASAYPVGTRVLYFNGATGTELAALIKAVHYDDPEERYYTITLEVGGNERQTPGTRLRPFSSRGSSSGNDGGGGGSSISATGGNRNEDGDGSSEVPVAVHPAAAGSINDERALSALTDIDDGAEEGVPLPKQMGEGRAAKKRRKRDGKKKKRRRDHASEAPPQAVRV